jgi:hypothetical protein
MQVCGKGQWPSGMPACQVQLTAMADSNSWRDVGRHRQDSAAAGRASPRPPDRAPQDAIQKRRCSKRGKERGQESAAGLARLTWKQAGGSAGTGEFKGGALHAGCMR